MRDIEAFMSPSGGRGFGESLYTGAALGLALGSDFMDRLILKPIKKRELDSIAKASSKMFSHIPKPDNTLYVGPKGAAFMQGPPSGPFIEKANIKKRDAYRSTQTAAANKRYKTLRRGWRAVSWGFLASVAFDVAEYVTTPGVSKIAAENDQQAMMPTMLDSAGAFTQRQRAIAAIYDSQMTSRNVIGNEARFMHK